MSRPKGRVTYDNQGRVVIVTGGASGIGRAIALAFQQSQATVYCFDVNQEQGKQLEAGLQFRHVDVADPTAVRPAVDDILRHEGGIDVLVNNAAIQPVASFAPLHKLPLELWEAMLRVNVTGYTVMSQAVVPSMIQQGSGVIVNLASAQAHRTAREVPAYGPTKAANMMQAKQWAVEYARAGIRVVSVSPGAIDTPLVRASLAQQGGEGALANRHPLGRLGRPEEIAAAVVWLSSSDASFVTATDLEVDGGLGGLAAFADPYEMPERFR